MSTWIMPYFATASCQHVYYLMITRHAQELGFEPIITMTCNRCHEHREIRRQYMTCMTCGKEGSFYKRLLRKPEAVHELLGVCTARNYDISKYDQYNVHWGFDTSKISLAQGRRRCVKDNPSIW
jgi:hypothetical protein